MNPINIICEHCGKDNLVEPEVEMDDRATCSYCYRLLYMEEKEIQTKEEFYMKWNENYESPYIHSKTHQQKMKTEFMADLDRVIKGEMT